MNLSLTTNLYRKALVYFCLSVVFFTIVFRFTFFEHPVTGDDSIRAYVNRVPNLLIPTIYKGLDESISVDECNGCFFEDSYKNAPKVLADGLYLSDFHPTIYYSLNNEKIPLFFAGKKGGLHYYVIKKLLSVLDTKKVLIGYNYFLSILTLVFFGLSLKSLYGNNVASIALPLLAISPVLAINTAPFLAEQGMIAMFWIMLYLVQQKGRFSFFLSVLSCFIGLYYKINFLCLLPAQLVLLPSRNTRLLAIISTSVILYLLIALYYGPIQLFTHEYVERSEGLIKPFAFWVQGFLDLITIFASPGKSLEHVTGVSTFLYPLSFNDLDPASSKLRHDVLSSFNLFEITQLILVILPFLFIKLIRKNQKVLQLVLAIFLCWFLSIFVTHMFANFSMDIQVVLGLFVALVAYICTALPMYISFKKAKALIVFFIVIYLLNSYIFVVKYYEKGPIPQFSFDLYNTISKDLMKRKINKPILFLSTEIGMLEYMSKEVITPFYVRANSFETFSTLFDLFQSGYGLLLLDAEWPEGNMISNLSVDKVAKIALDKNVKIESIALYNYRSIPRFWLFSFNNLEISKFHAIDSFILNKLNKIKKDRYSEIR